MTNKRAALRLVETRDKDREEWLQVRKTGIGSSDAAAAIGLCPYKSQLELWLEKTGRAPAVDAEPEDGPMYWGTLLERPSMPPNVVDCNGRTWIVPDAK